MNNPPALVITLLALLLPACGGKPAPPATTPGSPPPLTPVKFLTDWYPQPEHGGFYTALANGYYRDAGLDVEIVPGGPNAYPAQRIAVGDAQFGMNSSDGILAAVSQGIPLLAVGATMQHDPQGIMIRPESPVRTFQDLAGHSVAVTPGAVWIQYLTRKLGINDIREAPLTYSVANFLQDPEYIQQVFVTSEPYFVRKKGIEPRVLLIQDTGYDPLRVFFTSRRYAKENPETVRKFVAASIQGWRQYLQDPEPAHAEIARRNPEMEPERMTYSWSALKKDNFITGAAPDGHDIGNLDPARWKKNYDDLHQLGILKSDFDVNTAFTQEFLPSPPAPAPETKAP